METKHTPGPWEIQTNGGDCWIDTPVSAPKYRKDICRLSWGNLDNPANSRLIAAAPDLLTKLKEAAWALTSVADELESGGAKSPPSFWRDKARECEDAIAKATTP